MSYLPIKNEEIVIELYQFYNKNKYKYNKKVLFAQGLLIQSSEQHLTQKSVSPIVG